MEYFKQLKDYTHDHVVSIIKQLESIDLLESSGVIAFFDGPSEDNLYLRGQMFDFDEEEEVEEEGSEDVDKMTLVELKLINVTSIITLLIEALNSARIILWPNGKDYKKPNVFRKIKLGVIFLKLIIKIIKTVKRK